MTLDDLRSNFPQLGFALYALEPGGPVTLEVMDAYGGLFTFTAPSAAAAIATAFPPHHAPHPPPPDDTSVFD